MRFAYVCTLADVFKNDVQIYVKIYVQMMHTVQMMYRLCKNVCTNNCTDVYIDMHMFVQNYSWKNQIPANSHVRSLSLSVPTNPVASWAILSENIEN
mgnify:CR=1 FL=1